MHVTTICRAGRALVTSTLLLGVAACAEPGAGTPGPLDGLVTSLREAQQSEGAPVGTPAVAAAPALPVAAAPAPDSAPAPAVQVASAAAGLSAPAAKAAATAAAKPAPPDLATMQRQLDELESRVAALTAENQRQMERLSVITNGAIADMEQLFNSLRLELRSAPNSEPAPPPKRRRNTPPTSQSVPSGQGGPFLPWPPKRMTGDLSASDRVEPLLPDLKTLFLLHQVASALPLGAPLDEAVVTGPFGYRHDPFNRRSAFHDGIDLQAPMRSPIHAAAAGTVVVAGMRPAYGRVVEIDHGFGIHTRYAHLSAISVHEGDRVERNQLIGALGSSGRSASPHLHYEVLFNGRPHDPADLLVLARGIRSLR